MLDRYDLERRLIELATTHAQWWANLPEERLSDNPYLLERTLADEKAARGMLRDAGLTAEDTENGVLLYREISDRILALTELIDVTRKRTVADGGSMNTT